MCLGSVVLRLVCFDKTDSLNFVNDQVPYFSACVQVTTPKKPSQKVLTQVGQTNYRNRVNFLRN